MEGTLIGRTRRRLFIALGLPHPHAGGRIIKVERLSPEKQNEARAAERIAEFGKARGVDPETPWHAADIFVPYLESKGVARDEIDSASLIELASFIDNDEPVGSSETQSDTADAIPTTIKTALAGKRKLLPLCELLWGTKEEFVDWDTIGAKVWGNAKEDVHNMMRNARRLDTDLLSIKGCGYGIQSNEQVGARIYQRTKNGQN
jgi:hypothetical protein